MDQASIQEAKYKTQEFFGKTKEAFELGFAKIRGEETSGFDVAIIKATRLDDSVPKDKHVDTLIQVCSKSASREKVDYIIVGLNKRLAEYSSSWVVTLKTLVVFHRLMRETDLSFQEELLNYADRTGHTGFLRHESFNEETTKDTLDYSALIRAYSVYLDERVATFRSMRRWDESEEARTAPPTSYSKAELLEKLPAVLSLLEALFKCVPVGAAQTNDITVLACSLVLKELSAFYRIFVDGLHSLIKCVVEMDRGDAIKAVHLLKQNAPLNDKLAAFESAIIAVPALQTVVSIPAVEALPPDLMSNLDAFMAGTVKDLAGTPLKDDKPLVADLLGFQSFAIRTPSGPPAPVPGSFDAFAGPSALKRKEEAKEAEKPLTPLDELARLVVPPPQPPASAPAAPAAGTGAADEVDKQHPGKKNTFGDGNPFAEPAGAAEAPAHEKVAGTATAAVPPPPAATSATPQGLASAPEAKNASAGATASASAAAPAAQSAAAALPAKYSLHDDPLAGIGEDLFGKKPVVQKVPMKAMGGSSHAGGPNSPGTP